MTLAAGTRLGPYEILSPLGAGGMGEVYRARDAKLGRDVAIKVLPDTVAADPERLARFQREAQVLASLNHPHVGAIYGLEKSGETEALVLELVEGETLAERIARGPVPVEEALEVARQIADALEAAHEKGIVHRDLKPANVKLTPEGKVKVLDFGLAKAMTASGGGSSPEVSHSPTLTAQATQAGVVIGTAAYMSPEQARGKAVDKRADIWAFGAVLYEMLSGRKAFEGETVSDVLAAVLRADIDWEALPAATPSSVRRVLRRCLERDPKARFHDIADARIEMDEVPEASPASQAPALARPASRSRFLPVAAAVLLVLAAAGWWRALAGRKTAPRLQTNLAAVLPVGERFPLDDFPVFDLSRDGRRLVYAVETANGRTLETRSLEEPRPKAIPGSRGAGNPAISPDGQWVAFFVDGKLKRIPVDGGTPLTICDAPTPRGVAWAGNDSLVLAPEYTSGLELVPASGGKPVALTKPDAAKGERTHRWPDALPGGNAILFTIGTAKNPGNYEDAKIAILDRKTGKTQVLIDGGSMARYVAPGHIVYVHTGSLLAVPFDPEKLAVVGTPVPVLQGFGGDPSSGCAYFAAASDGTLAYVPGGEATNERTLVLANRKGDPTPLPLAPRHFQSPRFSPDGKRIAFSIGGGRGFDDDVWTYDIAGNALARLTFGSTNFAPVWSPDGARIAYGTVRGSGEEGIWAKASDGSGREEQLDAQPLGAELPTAWSPDGRSLAVDHLVPSPGVWILPFPGEHKPRLVQDGAFSSRFSPDGRWIVYSTVAGQDLENVFVQAADGSGGKWQITADHGLYPTWAGNEIFFIREGAVWTVEVQTRPTFKAGPPRLLFEMQYVIHTAPLSPYDVSSDGQRFVFMKGEQTEYLRQIDVVLNWADGLAHEAGPGENRR
jgi:Tol biopolymer transport system component